MPARPPSCSFVSFVVKAFIRPPSNGILSLITPPQSCEFPGAGMEARLARPHALSFVLVLLLASSVAVAQTQTFDAVSFTPPPGWAAAQDHDHVMFTFI